MTAWLFLTRWGNALLLLPVAACIAVDLWAVGDRHVALRWATWFGAAVLAVLATKVAFLGWGIGIARLDFTGISGHSTLAASVLPMGAWWLARERSPATRRRAVVAGAALALGVGVSRVVLSTHSMAEVAAGLALGALVAWVVIPRARGPRGSLAFRAAVVASVLIAGMLPAGPGDSEEAHGVVVRIALQLSGRSEPFTRSQLHNGPSARDLHIAVDVATIAP